MTIWERVASALSGLSVPAAANVLVVASESERPDAYLVYQVISDPPAQHADYRETLRTYRVQVSVYSRNGLAGLPKQVEAAMLAAGFTRIAGRELPYSTATGHFGFAQDFNYLEERD